MSYQIEITVVLVMKCGSSTEHGNGYSVFCRIT